MKRTLDRNRDSVTLREIKPLLLISTHVCSIFFLFDLVCTAVFEHEQEGTVKHIYFVAETKVSMSSLELREIEHAKIKCARKFFDEMNRIISADKVKYDVVDSYGKLMEIVGTATLS